MPLPDDWEPADRWCVEFRIPAGRDYVRALSAAIGTLTLPKTFERDVTGTGAKIVAHTWEDALYERPMTVREDDCDIAPPPTTTTDEIADASADILRYFIEWVAGDLYTALQASQTCEQWMIHITQELEPYTSDTNVLAALGRLCTQMSELPPDEQLAATTDCPYVGEFADLKAYINDNPFDWLNRLSSFLFNWLNTASGDLLRTLNEAAMYMGGHGVQSFVNHHGGGAGGGGATFGDTCGWTHRLNLLESDGGFTTVGDHGGVWNSGIGWETHLRTVGSDIFHNEMDIQFSFPFSWSQTNLKVHYEQVTGDDEGETHTPYLYVAINGVVLRDLNVGNPDGIDQELSFAGNYSGVDYIRVQAIPGESVSPDTTPGGFFALAWIEISGIGDNPFS